MFLRLPNFLIVLSIFRSECFFISFETFVTSLKTNFENDVIQNMKSCQENNLNLEMLSWKFQIANYTLRSFIGGAYYFDESREEWNGYGINVNIIISY